MWNKKVNRKELAEILNSGGLSSLDGLFESQSGLNLFGGSDDLELLWGDNPATERCLPSVIVVDRAEEKDLLAWVNTYVPTIRPLTAYSRISDRQTASYFLAQKPSHHLGKLEGACLGMMVGEMATYVGNRRNLRTISHTACLSTLSFSIARAAGLGLGRNLVTDVEFRWSHSREMLGAASLAADMRAVQTAWSVVRHLSKGELDLPTSQQVAPVVVESCSQILSTGEVHDHELEILSREVPEFSPLRSELNGPREDRLALFEQAASAIPKSRTRANSNAEFLCAYLASAISPGTLDHLHVLLPYVATLPGVLVWYGLCAGLSSKDNLLTGLGGLVRRVQRELSRDDDFLKRPSCDISFTELQLLSGSVREWSDIRSAAAGQLIIELLPSVNSYFRLSRAESALESPSDQVSSALNQLDSALDRAGESIKRFRQVAGLGTSHTWELESGRKRKT